jgi:hypothetical protein
MEIKTVNIYFLHNDDNIPFYIGKTNNIKDRINNHKRTFGKKTILEIIDVVDIKEWKFWEKYWISQFKMWGFILLNKNKGGGGPDFHDDEIKKLISKNKKVTGYKDNELRKQNISKSNKGKPNSMKGKKQPQEYVIKRAESNRKPCLQLKDGILIKEWLSSSEANDVYNGVNNVLNGRAKTAHGYVWLWKNDK